MSDTVAIVGSARRNGNTGKLMDRILAYPKIIFASPVYWYAPSAQMKVFIDRASDSSFINSFKDTFAYLGINYGGQVHADCSEGYLPDQYAKDVERFVKLVAVNSHTGPD